VATRDRGPARQRRPATARNDIWSMDFVADELADSRHFERSP